jgi:hypothetical protein
MSVLFQDANANLEPETHPKLSLWYGRLRKYRILIPLFPQDPEHESKWWYKLGYAASLVFSGWFYLLVLYFIYLASQNKFDEFYFLVAGGFLFAGIILSSVTYQITIYILRRKKLILD